MTAIATLQDLLVHQLRDLYSAERQQVQALPKMAKNATSSALKDAIRNHLRETEGHVNRLERTFDHLDMNSRGLKCKAMEGLIEEAKELFDEDIEPEVLDAGIVAAAQRVEHYEIAAYGTVCEFARALGHAEIVELMDATLAEEKAADRMLTTLAEGGINSLAMRGASTPRDHSEMDEDDREDGDAERGAGKRASEKPASRTSDESGRTKVGSRRH